MKAMLIPGLLVVLNSCKERGPQHPDSLRDIVLAKHLSKAGSIPEYDTADFNFRLLKAYPQNDTAYLANYLRDEEEVNVYKQSEDYKLDNEYPDSCIRQEQLQETAFEEAYRFKYQQSFCPFRLNVTVGRTGDSAVMQFIIYKPADRYTTDTTACSIVNQFQKTVSSEQWEQFSEAIKFADFWALKADNDAWGLDGSHLEVEGYLNRKSKLPGPAKYHKIHRWFGGPMAIGNAFRLLLLFSKNNEGCYIVTQNKQLFSRSSLFSVH